VIWLALAAHAADRTVPPAVIPPEILALPSPEEHAIGDARVLLVRVPGARKVMVELIARRGSLDLAGWPTPATRTLGWGMDLASSAHDAEDLALAEDLHDVDLSSWVGQHSSGVDLTAPREDLAVGVGLLGELYREPALPGSELARYRRDTIRWLEGDAASDPRNVADQALAFAWFPADSPFGARPDLDAWAHVKRGPVAKLHDALLAAPLVFLVVGDVGWADVEPLLTPVAAGIGSVGDAEHDAPIAANTGLHVIAVDMPAADQATIRLRTNAPWRDDPDRVPATVLDFNLGGSFLSRLNSNLREEKGWTYGVDSWLLTGETRGHWTVSVDVPKEHCKDAIDEIAHELDDVVQTGLTGDEIASARNSIVSGWNDTLLTAPGAAGLYESLFYDRDTIEGATARMRRLDEVTVDETRRVAAKYFAADDARTWVVVGDRKAIEPQLAALGWAPVWITPSEAVLGSF
jgi:zinc protease